MPNISLIFRQEITRVARREIRSQTLALRKSSAQYRREIAELKRQAAKLKSEVNRLTRQSGNGIAPRQSPDESAKPRFSAKSVVAQRKRLGISAADYGKLVGVSAQTIYAWEHGASRPRRAQLTALGTVRTLGKREAVTRIEQMRKKAPKKQATRR
jgi:DNA-binding transcriptional regulator YiaG